MSGILTVDGGDYLLNLLSNSDSQVDGFYIALIVGSQPGVAVEGAELEEPAFADYARARYENISANWFVQDGYLANHVQIAFPVAVSNWGWVRYWAVCDSDVGGRVFFVGDCLLEVVAGDQVILEPAALSLSIPTATWKDPE